MAEGRPTYGNVRVIVDLYSRLRGALIEEFGDQVEASMPIHWVWDCLDDLTIFGSPSSRDATLRLNAHGIQIQLDADHSDGVATLKLILDTDRLEFPTIGSAAERN